MNRHRITRGCLRFAGVVTHPPRKTRFRLLVRLYRTGLVTRRVPSERFQASAILLSRASWRDVSSSFLPEKMNRHRITRKDEPTPDYASHGRIGTRQLDRHEWWLPDLARALQMPVDKLRIWAIRGWVRSWQVPPRGLWVVWADGRERRRLWKLMADSRSSKSAEQTSS